MKDSTRWIFFTVLMALASLAMFAGGLRYLMAGHDISYIYVNLLGGVLCSGAAVTGYLNLKKAQKKGD